MRQAVPVSTDKRIGAVAVRNRTGLAGRSDGNSIYVQRLQIIRIIKGVGDMVPPSASDEFS